jgi:hypothetical protein
VNVELHIEELLLHGFPPGESQVIGEAVEQELSRLFTERGVPPSLVSGADVPNVDGGTLENSPGLTSEAFGARVARALYGGLELGTGERPSFGARESRGP